MTDVKAWDAQTGEEIPVSIEPPEKIINNFINPNQRELRRLTLKCLNSLSESDARLILPICRIGTAINNQKRAGKLNTFINLAAESMRLLQVIKNL